MPSWLDTAPHDTGILARGVVRMAISYIAGPTTTTSDQ
ncbi:hypothetical protein [Hoyosella subflava]